MLEAKDGYFEESLTGQEFGKNFEPTEKKRKLF